MAYPLLTNKSWRLSRALILPGAEYPLLVYVCREQKTFLWQLLWKIRTKGRERNEQQHNNTERLKSEWRYRQTVRDKKGINACEVMREGRVPDGAPEKNPVNCQWEMEALLEKIFSLIFFRLKTGILCHQEAVCVSRKAKAIYHSDHIHWYAFLCWNKCPLLKTKLQSN